MEAIIHHTNSTFPENIYLQIASLCFHQAGDKRANEGFSTGPLSMCCSESQLCVSNFPKASGTESTVASQNASSASQCLYSNQA